MASRTYRLAQFLQQVRLIALAASIGLAAASTAQSQADATRTDDKPLAVFHGETGGAIRNRWISAEWTIRGGRLSSVGIHGTSAASTSKNASIVLTEPFSVAIQGRGVLRASDLSIQGAARVEDLKPNPNASRDSDRLPGVAVHYELADSAGLFRADWALVMRQDSNYVRQVLTVTAGSKAVAIEDVRMIDIAAPGVEVAGTVKGSPLVAGDFFLGMESPLAECGVVGNQATSELRTGVPLDADHSAQYSSVIGVAADGQMRRAFLRYVERERAHPYRTFLHYNSWFDIGFFDLYTQADALDRIHAIGEELQVKRGVTLDSYLFDDGWDDHNDLWKIRGDFKDGFAPLQKAAAEYGTAPGVWLSPWGGYGPAKQERVAAAKRDGFEIVNGGLALSGPKYYARFHDAVMEMVSKYGVNQFKFDGTGNVDQVVKGSAFSSDFDAAIHLMGDLRTLQPDLYINLTTGTYPSPFWLLYADSIWRGGDDTEFAGVGSNRERWITYRDAETYDGIVKRGRLFPLNSLMLHGIVYARQAPHLSDDPGGDFRNEIRSYFGSGTQLQELYITPSLLTNANWDDLAEAAKWSRSNAATLADTHWVGGDPRWLAVYGWAAWSPQKGILTLRNPSDKPQEISIDIGPAFELPAGAARRFKAQSPWAKEASQPRIDVVAGQPYSFHLQPFEVMTREFLPQR